MCYISIICCSLFLNADDILLFTATISGLQALLMTCKNYVNDVDMRINVNQLMCIRFGRRYITHRTELNTLFGGVIKWVDCCRYLGVFFNKSCTFKYNFDNAKSCFFTAFNALYRKAGRL